MKITRSFKIQSLILAAALSTGLGFVSSVFAQDRYYILDTNTKELTALGSLGGYTYARGINDAGQVVGTSQTVAGNFHAFITGPNGVGMRDLGTLDGDFSEAHGINKAGQVVGWSDTAGVTHSFITGPNGGGMTDLGTLGGNYSQAYGINDVGQVVGWSHTAKGEHHAFITGPNGGSMRDLGTLGGLDSLANGINDTGQVVGESRAVGGIFHAFITGPNGEGMTDLNSLVGLPAETILHRALDINNAGQVIVLATPFVPGIPEPRTYALMLAGLILVGLMAGRKRLPA